jgi:putative heme-binding domain-containing protein
MLVAVTVPTTARGAEPWADARLAVRDGLVIWLDASRQSAAAAAEAAKKPATQDGATIDAWLDGSGNQLHFNAPQGSARPRFQRAGEAAVVRFDGEGNYLLRGGVGRAFREITVFIVASPLSNAGGFRAMFALNENGKNDYTSGMTIDQSFGFTPRFEVVNVEGAGFGGVQNLLRDASPFGTVRTMTVTSAPGAGGTKLFLDGKPQGQRDRGQTELRADQIVVGARCFSNEPRPPYVQGFFDGDVAEVIVYDRVLPEKQRRAVEAYLGEKYAKLALPPASSGEAGTKRLVTVPDPPPLQIFIPGFTVRELPLKLPNLNNIRYRPDGKLVALGYNGNVYLLSDADGDGLEDHADVFFESQGKIQAPIGMALTPPGYKLGTGVFVASKRKISLITDSSDRGDKADKEIIVAEGWEPLVHNVDALGVAVDKEGAVYFGLGTTNFTNAYLIGPDGAAHYDLKSDRGTIQRVSSDFKKRETVCTGIRFSVAMAFNPAGDLFATDQEGATWLANGNPFDELLHIEPGRHYGFPPRHPKHLPGVIDEPSVFDYGPQHQSTCGLAFNAPVNDGPIFGPAFWANDAFVTGYSRGKLFRTKLVKTAAGYVAQNQLLACARMLVVDSCVSPRGDLVVAMHSGAPDWGSGPNGEGKLFKISHADRSHPQPVMAWAAGPREVRVAFDRPVEPSQLRGLSGNASIEYGSAVSAGDRFESLRPGYAVVQRQLRAPRYELPVLGAAIAADKRTLVLSTAPHPMAATYALTLPGMGRPAAPAAGELRQMPAIDLAYDLNGVEATWKPESGHPPLTTWLPHLDLAVASALTAASGDHDAWQSAVHEGGGDLRLSTQLDPWDVLRPAVQSGSKLDYDWPAEHVTLTFSSSSKLEVSAHGVVASATVPRSDAVNRVTLQVDPKQGELVPLRVTLHVPGGTRPDLSVWYHTAEDPRPRALPLRRMRLPWAPSGTQLLKDSGPHTVPQLEGGSWARGRAVFFGAEAACFKCHRLGGEGGAIGPDLSNLHQRDYDSVLKDIVNPSAAINPDFVAYAITLAGGDTLVGVPRDTGGPTFTLGEPGGTERTVRRADVKSMQPLPTSIMPHGIDGILGPQRMKDLMIFLLTEPFGPAPIQIGGMPKARSRADVQKVLGAPPATKPAAALRPLHVLLAAGPKDHGQNEHDYPLWQKRWEHLLSTAEGVEVQTSFGWPTAEQFRAADVIVFYSDNPGFTAERCADLDAYLKRGGGLVYIHFAVDGHDAPEALAARIGLAWRGGKSAFRHGPLDLRFPDADHAITRNFENLKLIDESYWNLTGDPAQIHVLAEGIEDGKPRPLMWTREPAGGGRVFVSIPGHFTWTFDDPLFRVLILRGIAWTASQPADRLSPLAIVGAHLAP